MVPEDGWELIRYWMKVDALVWVYSRRIRVFLTGMGERCMDVPEVKIIRMHAKESWFAEIISVVPYTESL